MNLDQFVTYLRAEKRYSAHTITSYRHDLNSFCNFLEDVYGLESPTEIEAFHIRSWLAQLVEISLSPRSVNRKISTLNSYFKYLMKLGLVQVNPAATINSLKQVKELPSIVEQDNLIIYINEMPKGSFSEFRNYLLLKLLYSTGMRRAELISLKERDVEHPNNEIKILGKGKKIRFIPIGEDLAKELSSYIQIKSSEFQNKNEHLFVTDKGEKLYPNFVYRTVKSFLRQITTKSKKSPHALRHSFASHLLNNGADLLAIKELLGHSSLQATQVYTHTNIEELKKIYKKSHPSS